MDETWIREFSYTCTEEEIYLCLKRSGQRKAGPVRVGVQTGILLLLTIYCLIGFFADGMTDWRAFLPVSCCWSRKSGFATTRPGRQS